MLRIEILFQHARKHKRRKHIMQEAAVEPSKHTNVTRDLKPSNALACKGQRPSRPMSRNMKLK